MSSGAMISMSCTLEPEPPEVSGVFITVHDEPLYRATKMCVPRKPSGPCTRLPPAAHTSLGPLAATASKLTHVQPEHAVGLGVGMMVHCVPSQRKAMENV